MTEEEDVEIQVPSLVRRLVELVHRNAEDTDFFCVIVTREMKSFSTVGN